MTPLLCLMTTLSALLGIILFCAAVWFCVPLLWGALCISANAIWSVFVYWSNKSHYIGAVTCFMTLWFGLTIIPLKVTDKYIVHRRCLIVAAITISIINTLFFVAYIATSPGILKTDPGIVDGVYFVFALSGPFILIAVGKEFWKKKHYGY